MERSRFSAQSMGRRARRGVAPLVSIILLTAGMSLSLLAAPQEVPEQTKGTSALSPGQEGHEQGVATPLAKLIEEAERNNPVILAAESAAKAATYAAPQMSSLPDPQFTLQQFSVGSPRPFAGYTNSILPTSGWALPNNCRIRESYGCAAQWPIAMQTPRGRMWTSSCKTKSRR
jgi:hypothetical protein